MKLQFKEQSFQLKAVDAVVGCFTGQPLQSASFTLERTKELIRQAKNVKSGLTTIDFDEYIYESIGYRNRTIAITQNQLLENIKRVQRGNDIIESSEIILSKGESHACNLTVEMETGTGKTYTYIRTMYELHKHYGWSKFIIIVPSIAIREGVHKSFELTEEHFMEIYGHKIKPFIYNSSRPQDIENFASDNRISVMIINTQAFNAKGKGRIYQELDTFGTRRPIEIIAQTNPVIIIDEPQSVDGVKTLESMRDFNSLFILRYSATHKELYNQIYRLDALDAYNQKLVKKIEVKGISLKGTTGTTGYLYLERIEVSPSKPPLAVLEYEKRGAGSIRRVREKLKVRTNLFELSGDMPQYRNCSITNIDAHLGKIDVGGMELFVGEAVGDIDEKSLRRIQIRETILSHLQKERQLFSKGIKVLTLFFIDHVENYRQYDELGNMVDGEYAKMFEQEYNTVRNEFVSLFEQEYNQYLHTHSAKSSHRGYEPAGYFDYLKRDDAAKVHSGYFSIDKNKRLVDPTTKRGKEDSDDTTAYELIMKDKVELLSFSQPVRFIFSHSALKEGWDNPNVFQICALKHSDASVRRRQEVGRGMRLCVNSDGVRLDFETIGDDVHKTNMLTVIASESYEAFAKGLQAEIAETIKNRPTRADREYFVGKVIITASGEELRITPELAEKINKNLYKQDIIDDDNKITETGRLKIAQNDLTFPEHLQYCSAGVTKLLHAIMYQDMPKADNACKKQFLGVNQNFHKKEFQELWNKINYKSTYEVRFDSAELINTSVIYINARLNVAEKTYEVKRGELRESTQSQLEAGEGFVQMARENKRLKTNISNEVAFDVIGEIVNKTNLTRRTTAMILQKISPAKFCLIERNPEEFLAECGKLINEAKAQLIINHITYYKSDERYDAITVFGNDQQAILETDVLKKHIYDYLVTDSKVESAFAKELDIAIEVNVFAKLPKSFYISTPVGNYSPDWAIAFDKGSYKDIYFVVETKGDESVLQLKPVEQLKEHCAIRHFAEISNGEVKYHLVKNYDNLLKIIQ